jgi:hypothetical protein
MHTMASRPLLDLTARAEEFEFHWENLAFLRGTTWRYTAGIAMTTF